MATMTHDRSVSTASGFGAALGSAATFALSGPLARGLMNAGWSPAAAVAVRILVAAVVLVPFAAVAVRGRWGAVRRNLPFMAAFGAFPVAGAQLGYFNAVARMPVGVALLVEYTAPVAVVGWLWLRHHQRPTRATVVGAVIALVGLLLVLDLTSSTPVSGAGVAWALLATAGAASYYVLSSRADDDALPGPVLAAGGLLIGGLLLALAGAAGVLPFTVTTAPVVLRGVALPWWLVVVVFGVVTAGLAYVLGIAGARRLGARLASFVGLSEVLAALAFAALLLGEVPRAVQLVGGALVIVGVVVVRLGERTVTAP